MKLQLSVVTGLLLFLPISPLSAESQWTVKELHLPPHSVQTRTITIGVSNGRREIRLSADVRLEKVSNQIIHDDKLAIVGNAGNRSETLIFDLNASRLIDRFLAWESKPISNSLIASIELYFEHGMRWPTDVVLIYDLDKSPGENRLPNIQLSSPISDVSNETATAGFPVFPPENSRTGSYRNVVPDILLVRTVIGAPYFVLLKSKWLVFISSEGKDFLSSHNYLVVVDLSHGLLKPRCAEVPIPAGDFKHLGENPKLIRVEQLVPQGPYSVRLIFSDAKYGLESEIVDLRGATFQ